MGRNVIWLAGRITSPPFSERARKAAGYLLRMLQAGEIPEMPMARPMPTIGPRCLELRIPDAGIQWRIMCRVDRSRVLVIEVFAKKQRKTPRRVNDTCRQRLIAFDRGRGEDQ